MTTKQPSVIGKGVEIFFPSGSHKERAAQKEFVSKTQTATAVKMTFRIPMGIAKEFDNLFSTIKKEKIFFSKNRLGVLAVKRLVEQNKKGQLKRDSL